MKRKTGVIRLPPTAIAKAKLASTWRLRPDRGSQDPGSAGGGLQAEEATMEGVVVPTEGQAARTFCLFLRIAPQAANPASIKTHMPDSGVGLGFSQVAIKPISLDAGRCWKSNITVLVSY